MLRFNCPECHAKIEVEEKFAGKTGKCAECGAPLTVPDARELQATGLDALLGKPGAGVYGAYNQAPDAQWDEPAAAQAPPEEVALPEIPAEVLAAAKARKKKTMQYIIAAIVLVLILLVLALPLVTPKPKEPAAPAQTEPVPTFAPAAQQ